MENAEHVVGDVFKIMVIFQPMVIVVTVIRLKSIWKFFALSSNSLQVVRQLKAAPGNISYRSRGFGKVHYTLSAWESVESMRSFARSGAHKSAMGKSAQLADEIRTLSFEADEMPDWESAKARLMSEGRVLNYS